MNNPAGVAPRQLGFWMCVALVVGNIIGSGIFLLPASLAPYGLNSIWAWLFTSAGAIALAMVFGGLSRALPGACGPYDYARQAFGPLPAFLVIWGYWLSNCVTVAAISSALVSYLSHLLPWITASHTTSILLTLAFVWLLTGVNIVNMRSAGKIQVATAVLKVIPLLAIVGLGLYLAATGSPMLGTARLASTTFDINAVTAAATLTLFALCGMESASVASDKVHDAERTIMRATLTGTVLAALIYVIASSTVMMLVPSDQLAKSNAPFADVAALFWGPGVAHWFAFFAAISCFGALNGWILVNGQLGLQLARNGLFPQAFTRETAAGTPVVAIVTSSIVGSILVLVSSGESIVAVFTFLVLLSTTAVLFMYLLCSLAVFVLLRRGAVARSRFATSLAIAGAIGSLFSLWAIAGAGISIDPGICNGSLFCWTPWKSNPVYLGFFLLALGVPVYYAMRARRTVALGA